MDKHDDTSAKAWPFIVMRGGNGGVYRPFSSNGRKTEMPRRARDDFDLIDKEEVAQMYGITVRTLERRLKRRLIPAPVVGTSRPVLFVRSTIVQHLKDGNLQPPRPARKR